MRAGMLRGRRVSRKCGSEGYNRAKKSPSYGRMGHYYDYAPVRNRRISLTEFFESGDQVVSDQLGRAAFDLMAFDHMHQFAVFKEGNSG